MDIKVMPIKYNYSKRLAGRTIKYIVVHDTGNTRAGANARNHYVYFNTANRSASAHYFVDDKEIIQTVDDSLSAWHIGDGKGKYGIINSDTIGIEICVNSDGDYEKAVANTVWLVAQLMKKHNVPLSRVIRHYDASRKICPRSMSANGWARWHKFKVQVAEEYETQNKPKSEIFVPEGAFKVKVKINGVLHEMNGVEHRDSRGYITNYGSFREILEAVGYEVGWDSNTKTILAEKKV